MTRKNIAHSMSVLDRWLFTSSAVYRLVPAPSWGVDPPKRYGLSISRRVTIRSAAARAADPEPVADFAARKSRDSGIQRATTAKETSVTRPPRTNTACQPNVPISGIDARPPRVAPTGYPAA